MVGGAPVTQEYADAVGADGYAADASTAVRLAKTLIEQRRQAVGSGVSLLVDRRACGQGPVFGCSMCGQCVLHSTGLTCPMTCPKQLRNGPCGGVRADGGCEVKPEMRCVWLKALGPRRTAALDGRVPRAAAAGRQPALGHIVVGELGDEARPPDPARLGAHALMSRLEDALGAGRLVAHRGARRRRSNDLDSVARYLEPMAPYLDAVNATDNTAAHAHASALALALAIKALRRGAGAPARLPRPQPPRAPVRDRRRRAARDREHLLPDRRRRHRRRRARGAARLRPRRPAAARDGPGHRGGPLPLGSPGRPGAAPLPRRGRESGRAAVRAPRRARAGRRPAPARASSSSSSASSPSGSSGSWPRPSRTELTERVCRCCRRS